MGALAEWLAGTQASLAIQDMLWIVPTVQTVHILAMSVVMSSMFMIGLRILNLAGGYHTMTEAARRFLPWMWWALAVNLITGLVLIIGEPWRTLNNPTFWLKMALLAVAVAAAAGFERTLRRDAGFWERRPGDRKTVRVLVATNFLLWCCVIVAGRWIAYTDVPPP
ncbi:DUF6644 family protein [Arenibaculum pallidiluteum]|uniref:DUF6644 family protein n=1 Tax=Arenibaculum pallidiluteum TaxID=2812559 RepID=UPI001A9770D0|nr:DUF6644 family protein [Arenibaculum pallidiluteum]